MSYFLLIFALVLSSGYGQNCDKCNKCDAGWQSYNGCCYKAFNANVNANDARAACQGYGGNLVSIEDDGEDCFVKGLASGIIYQLAQAPEVYIIHIGYKIARDASGKVTGGTWDDDSSYTYGKPNGQGNPPWANGKAWDGKGEPKASGNEVCCAMKWNSKCAGDWAVVDCGGPKGGYVCKKCGGVKPPQPTEKCPNGYTQWNSKCYKVYNKPDSSVATAKSQCKADGGNLASIHSEEENTFCNGLISHNIPSPPASPDYMRIFMGLEATRKPNAELETCKWADGSEMDYGSPFVPNFKEGFDPWSSGAAYGGVKEPKHRITAVTGFFVKNNLQTGGWCLGPVDDKIQFNGAFICECKPQKSK